MGAAVNEVSGEHKGMACVKDADVASGEDADVASGECEDVASGEGVAGSEDVALASDPSSCALPLAWDRLLTSSSRVSAVGSAYTRMCVA